VQVFRVSFSCEFLVRLSWALDQKPHISLCLSQSPPIAVALAKLKQDGSLEQVTNKTAFNVVELSDLMGWDSSPVKKELKLLEWNLGPSFLVIVLSLVTEPAKNVQL